MRRIFQKKTTEGNARNSPLINCPDVTKIRKTRVVRGNMSHHARMRTMVEATENIWFLRKVQSQPRALKLLCIEERDQERWETLEQDCL